MIWWRSRGIRGSSETFANGCRPSPSQTIPSGSEIALTSAMCSRNSRAVSCRLVSGAPESSSWPPGLEGDGAAVALEADELAGVGERLPAVLALDRREQRVDPALALVGNRRRGSSRTGPSFSCSVPTRQSARGVSPSRK